MIWEILLITLAIEGLTILSRFIFGPMKARYQKMKFRYKVRIHHGYIGILLMILYIPYRTNLLIILGASLLLSDAIHHFIFLKLATGKTEFP